MSKLIANMVGRNEADRFLPEVLDHLKSCVDEIVFTDDCSDDNTPEIAHKYGAMVYKTETPTFVVHEGNLRNFAWSNLMKHANPGDWILAIDCDEKLWATVPNLSLNKLINLSYDVLNIQFIHKWNATQYRVDKAWAPHPSSRLFRYYLGGKFKDSKLACGSEPTYVQTLIARGNYLLETGLVMEHLGYQRDEDKKAKYERYMNLDGGDFHAKAHIESIMDPDPELVDWS